MKKIMDAQNSLHVELFQTLLEENGIAVLQVDKTDSAYVVLGHKELFVKEEDFDRASLLLEEFRKNHNA